MTQYLLSVWHSDRNPIPDDPAVMQRAYKQVDAFNADLQASGAWVFGGGLHAPESATVVRAEEGGDPVMTDGPFAETREVVGGYWMIQVKSKQEAVEWASRCPAADGDIIEVRQVFEMSEFPEDVKEAAAGLDVNPKAAMSEQP